MPYRRRPSDVLPGEYFVGGSGHRIHTVLGSCVSVTLWCPQRRIGAMSHCLLSCRLPTGPLDAEPSGRNGEGARLLLRAHGIALASESLFGQGSGRSSSTWPPAMSGAGRSGRCRKR